MKNFAFLKLVQKHFLFKLFLISLPFFWILKSISASQFLQVFHQVAWWVVPLIVVSNLSGMMLQGVRWWMLFPDKLPFLTALRIHFIGIYYSTLIPSSSGQELIRTAMVSKDVGTAESWGVAWIFKLTGFVSILIWSLLGTTWLSIRGLIPVVFLKAIVLGSLFICVFLLFSFSKKMSRPVSKYFLKYLPQKWNILLSGIRESVYLFRYKWKLLCVNFFLSILQMGILLFATGIVVYGISGKWKMIECFVFFPLIELACSILPITPGGAGLREGLMAMSFSFMQLNKEEIGLLLLFSLFSMILRLVGGLPLLWSFLTNSRSQIAKYK